MGTGKTRSSLYAADFLIRNGEATKVLVVAPLSTLTTVWDREVFDCFPHLNTAVLYGTKKKRLALLDTDADVYIINHDGVKTLEKDLIARPDIDIVVLDELALYRNHRTAMWKATNRVLKGRKFVWGLTGAPTPKAPTDAFAQVKLLTPERVAHSFRRFQMDTMHQVSQFRWIAKREANDVVHAAMQPSVRYAREDCIDLPPTTYSTLELEMSPPQKAAYKEMVDEMQLIVNSPTFSGSITAANAGVQVSKLMQIGCGFAYGTDASGQRTVAEYDSAPREKVLTDIIDAARGKVIVFAPFIHTVDMLANKLEKAYMFASGNLFSDIGKIHGGTTKAHRDTVFNDFQFSAHPRILVAHPKTMSHGLTLTAADTIVWYSPPFSLEIYEQANARITRPGQTRHTHIVHIQASKMEKKVYNTLQVRGNLQTALLDLFRGV
tara:strand:- start:1904 stop:3211 length:1308 start_codon:yes stop_codon:yes gene_type:complete